MINLFNKQATIYNVIPKRGNSDISYSRRVLKKCNIQGGFNDKSNGTTRIVVNAKTVITKEVDRYKPPTEDGFYGYQNTDRAEYFTANPGDFIVFAEVNDTVATPLEFKNLQNKYKDNGMIITQAFAYLYGRSTDNVMMTNA